MILKLNDKLEEVKYRKLQPKNELIEKLENNKYSYKKINDKYDYNTRIITKSLYYVEDNMIGEYSHKNYMEYLFNAWDTHSGIIISPDIIWYTLQCELSSIVSTKVDTYRDLFTTSQEKQEIKVLSSSLTIMPLGTLMNALRNKIPSDISNFLPEFSTTTQRSIFARYAAFCDMVSPYYNYSMFCCGFPAIDVQGDPSDWQKLRSNWQSIGKLFTKDQDYISRVDGLLDRICNSLNDVSFWKEMLTLDKCGSGHQFTVNGWINNLYVQQPDLAFPENYPSHISVVKYKQLDTDKDYEMKQGLICSKKENGFLIPDFAHIIYEKKDETVTEIKTR